MAKAAWCVVAPMTGKENGVISITLPAYTGRLARNTVATVTNKHGTKPSKNITANQAGAAVTTTMDNAKPDIPATGGSITISGRSNSSKLKYTLMGSIFDVAINWSHTVTVKVNNVAISNDTAITGDPGASGLYDFTATFDAPVAEFPVDVPLVFTVTDDLEVSKTCTMKLLSNTSKLSVDKESLNFTAAGGAQTVNITSNDEWAIS